MNYLGVKAIQTSDTTAKVLWYTSRTRRGAMEVNIPFPVKKNDVEVLAELAVIRNLTIEDCLMPNPVLTGKGICLVVTKGAIRKILNEKTENPTFLRYGAYLHGRLRGCEVDVEKKNTYLPPENTEVTKRISLANEPHETIMSPSMGEIKVTDHAFKRFLERVYEGAPEKAFNSLTLRLSHPELVQVPIPDRALRHKIRKYGEENVAVLYKHPTDVVHFVVVNRPGAKDRALVTVFCRNENAT